MRKKVLRLTIFGIFGLVLALLILVFVLLPLFGPFSSIAIPASCSDEVSHLASVANFSIPGIGTGKLLTKNADVAVVVAANYGQSPFYTYVYVVNLRHANHVANYFAFPTNVVDAGFDGDTLYLFNDKLGHFVSAVNGESTHDIVTSDNYRGLYKPNRIQTDLTISGITAGHSIIFRHHIHMTNS